MELEFHRLSMKHEGLRIRQRGYEARLTASLASEGRLHPVLVVSGQEERSEYVLIDGYLRVKSLQVLGRDTVEAMVLPLEEKAALLFRYCQESVHPRTALEDGWLLRELIEDHGMSRSELSQRLQRTESWVSRRLSLVEKLPETAQELVRRGELCAYGAMKYLVPLARAKKSSCKELVSHLVGRRTSARELQQVYETWQLGDAEQRRLVVSNPELFLKAKKAATGDGSKRDIGDDCENVTNDLQILDAVSNRARRRIRELKGTIPVAAVQGWRAAQSSFDALRETMEKRIDVRSRDTDGNFEAQG